MDEGTPERAVANWLMDQPKGTNFRLTPEAIDGIADHEELQRAVRELVYRGYVEVGRKPIGSIYVKPTDEGTEVFWGE